MNFKRIFLKHFQCQKTFEFIVLSHLTSHQSELTVSKTSLNHSSEHSEALFNEYAYSTT